MGNAPGAAGRRAAGAARARAAGRGAGARGAGARGAGAGAGAGAGTGAGGGGGAAAAAAAAEPLLDLGEAFHAVLVRRPAESVRSPYVADIELTGPAGGAPFPPGARPRALAWVPGLDLGGQCSPGARLLVTPAPPQRTPSPKPRRTEYWVQLVRVDEPECADGETWIGAMPNLGTDLARKIIDRGLLPALAGYPRCRAEVRGAVAEGSRADFVLDDPADPGRRSAVVEVKNVVCADYAPATAPEPTKKRCVVVGRGEPYERAGVFPWGSVAQDFEGERVVSARAVKHITELRRAAEGGRARAVLLFVANRRDCRSVRACHEACPVFADELERSRAAGVEALAVRVRWAGGRAFFDGEVPVAGLPPEGLRDVRALRAARLAGRRAGGRKAQAARAAPAARAEAGAAAKRRRLF